MVEGLANADQQAGLLPLWPTLCAALVASERDVIVDLGRVSSVHPGLTIAAHSQRILIVVRPQLEELVRLRDRVRQLLDVADGDASRLLVVVISPDKMAARDQRAASRILADAGLPYVQVVGFPFLPKEVAAFYAGTLNRRGYLWRTAVDLAASLQDGAPTDSRRAGTRIRRRSRRRHHAWGDAVDHQLIRRLHQATGARASAWTNSERLAGNAPNAESYRVRCAAFANDVVAEQMQAVLAAGQVAPTAAEEEALVDAILARMFGAGRLQQMLEDPALADVTDLDINGCDEVWATFTMVASNASRRSRKPMTNLSSWCRPSRPTWAATPGHGILRARN